MPTGDRFCTCRTAYGCMLHPSPLLHPLSPALTALEYVKELSHEKLEGFNESVIRIKEAKMKKAWLGIDPGKSGALAAITEDGLVEMFETPTVTVGKKEEYDLASIVNSLSYLYNTYKCKCAIEKVGAMPGQGVVSMFSMGYGFGIWRMALVALEIPHELVTPQAWKKLLMSGQSKEKKASVIVASLLYPSAHSLLFGPKGGAKDGNGDALLIAEYSKRMNP